MSVKASALKVVFLLEVRFHWQIVRSNGAIVDLLVFGKEKGGGVIKNRREK